MGNCAGVDWASEKHDVHVADEAGEELLAATFAHDEAGLAALCRALVRLKVERVAIERPDGRADRAAAGRGADRDRDPPQPGRRGPRRGSAPRAGSPTGSTRSCCASWPAPIIIASGCSSPTATQTKALRALTRAREDLVQHRVALTNQLRAELERFWPGPIGLFTRSRQPDLARVPGALSEPDRRARTRRAAPRGVPRASALLRRQDAGELLAKLRRAPEGRAGELEMQRPARGRARARRRAAVRSSTRSASSRPQISHAVRAHPDGADLPLVLPLPRIAWSAPRRCSPRSATAARATPPLTRSPPTPAKPRSRSNPANARSARSAGAATTACATRSRRSLTAPGTGTPGPPTTTPAPATADTTTHARSAPSAAPGAASLWRCWQDHTPYDPARHGGLQRHIAVMIPNPSGPRPDLAATQRMPAPPSPTGRPAGPSAKRLTASRQPLTHSPLDTGRLARPLLASGSMQSLRSLRC